MPYLNAQEKTQITALANKNDLYAQGWRDHENHINAFRAGHDGTVLRAKVATTANHGLTGLTDIDGVTPVAGDIVFARLQTDTKQNGLYIAASGAWSRLRDSDSNHVMKPGSLIVVEQGTLKLDTLWMVTANAVVVGTDNITVSELNVSTLTTSLALTTTGNGASMVGIEDSAGKITGINVETALAELALAKYNLGLTTNGNGSSDVGLEDSALYFAAVNVEAAIAEMAPAAKDLGIVETAHLLFANQPAHNDTIAIGADTYQFKLIATDIVVTNDAYIGVVISAVNAAGTKTNLIAAINGTAGDVGLDKSDASPAISVGTLNVLATSIGTTVRVQPATAPGGTAVVGAVSIVLAESITDAADVWDVGAVNMNTLGGASASWRKYATAEITLTSDMITNGFRVTFPFTPVGFRVQARKSDGGIRTGAVTDLANIATAGVNFSGLGQVAPAYQATDILWVEGWSA